MSICMKLLRRATYTKGVGAVALFDQNKFFPTFQLGAARSTVNSRLLTDWDPSVMIQGLGRSTVV